MDFAVEAPGAALGRYPSPERLTGQIAARFDLEPGNVLVTAGADDGLLRLALAYLAEGREIVLPTPTFVMIERYAQLAGGTVIRVDWPAGAAYPTDAVLAAVTEHTSLIAVVSPNNPTGNVADPVDLRRLASAAPHTLLVVDGAYAEFASQDLTSSALGLGNAVVLRTFSKAYGCAGLRVGYAMGPEHIIEALRSAGNPYPCATPSLMAASGLMAREVQPLIQQVTRERTALAQRLIQLGFDAHCGEGNFVYAEGPRARVTTQLLAGFGIAIRSFPAVPGTRGQDALRITCPGDEGLFQRLMDALDCVCTPEALLFDMDGVLVDVSRSYRVAIQETARSFGIQVDDSDIEALKNAGDANDDWRLTQALLSQAGVDVPLDEVTERFERLYQGSPQEPGLKAQEASMLSRRELSRLGQGYRLGIVTGRPLKDAIEFLEAHDLMDLFGAVVTRDDAPLKPSPAPTRLALERLGVERAWLIGDTPDDIRSASAAGALGVGAIAPDPLRPAGASSVERTRCALYAAGAGAVLNQLSELQDLLP